MGNVIMLNIIIEAARLLGRLVREFKANGAPGSADIELLIRAELEKLGVSLAGLDKSEQAELDKAVPAGDK